MVDLQILLKQQQPSSVKNEMQRASLSEYIRAMNTVRKQDKQLSNKVEGISHDVIRQCMLGNIKDRNIMTKFVEYGIRDVEVLAEILTECKTIDESVEYAAQCNASLYTCFSKSRANILVEYVCNQAIIVHH